jgi:hypothetical protein
MICAFGDEKSHRGPDFGLAVGYAIAEVEVSTGMGQWPSTKQQAGTSDKAPFDGSPNNECDPVPPAVVPYRRDTAMQVSPQVGHCDQGHHLVRILYLFFVGLAVSRQGDVAMRVNQAGDDCRAVESQNRFGIRAIPPHIDNL